MWSRPWHHSGHSYGLPPFARDYGPEYARGPWRRDRWAPDDETRPVHEEQARMRGWRGAEGG